MHVPIIGPRPMPGRNFRIRLAAYNGRSAAVRKVAVKAFTVGTAAGTPLAHATGSILDNGL
jgi:hypothetical protein